MRIHEAYIGDLYYNYLGPFADKNIKDILDRDTQEQKKDNFYHKWAKEVKKYLVEK